MTQGSVISLLGNSKEDLMADKEHLRGTPIEENRN